MNVLFFKKSIAVMLIVAMLVTTFSSFTASSAFAAENSTEEVAESANLEDGVVRYLTDEEIQQYMLTGQINQKERFIPIIVGGANAFFGIVVEAIIATTVSAAITWGAKWFTNTVKQDIPKSVKVSYATFDPHDYKNWVCDTCVNSSYYVDLAQRVLGGLSFSVGTIDGKWDSTVKSAVINFQKLAGLTQDGSVGPATWAKMATK